MIFNEIVLYKNRLGTDFKESNPEVKKHEVVLLKDLLVIELENTDCENQEIIAQRVHQNTFLTQSKKSSRTTKPLWRYSLALYYILSTDICEYEIFNEAV